MCLLHHVLEHVEGDLKDALNLPITKVKWLGSFQSPVYIAHERHWKTTRVTGPSSPKPTLGSVNQRLKFGLDLPIDSENQV